MGIKIKQARYKVIWLHLYINIFNKQDCTLINKRNITFNNSLLSGLYNDQSPGYTHPGTPLD